MSLQETITANFSDFSGFGDDWVGTDVDSLQSGSEFYLIGICNQNQTNGAERLVAQQSPGCKNMSGEPCAEGWLGTTDNIDRYAHGKYRVIKVESRELYMGTVIAEKI